MCGIERINGGARLAPGKFCRDRFAKNGCAQLTNLRDDRRIVTKHLISINRRTVGGGELTRRN